MSDDYVLVSHDDRSPSLPEGLSYQVRDAQWFLWRDQSLAVRVRERDYKRGELLRSRFWEFLVLDDQSLRQVGYAVWEPATGRKVLLDADDDAKRRKVPLVPVRIPEAVGMFFDRNWPKPRLPANVRTENSGNR